MIDPTIAEYYGQAPEETRLEHGPFRFEEARTRELIGRFADPGALLPRRRLLLRVERDRDQLERAAGVSGLRDRCYRCYGAAVTRRLTTSRRGRLLVFG